MANFNYELGFDWNLPPFLKWDRLFFPDGKSQNHDQGTHLTVGDLVCFNVINLTSGAGTKDYSIASESSIIFRPRKSDQPASSPFQEKTLVFNFSGEATGIGGPGTSGLGDGSYPFWAPVVSLTPIENSGFFEFIAVMTISGPGGWKKTFIVDPEMIVGSVG